MSTLIQVTDDFSFYVCAYLIDAKKADHSILLSSNNLGLFTLSSDESGPIISHWEVEDLDIPTFTDLEAIDPSEIVTLKKTLVILQMQQSNPNLWVILKDIYNKIALQVNTHVYDTDSDFINFLKTI